ncbi:MAG: hypothetical protein ACRC11_08250, partial [Xenococcaceae cyanobacterium]
RQNLRFPRRRSAEVSSDLFSRRSDLSCRRSELHCAVIGQGQKRGRSNDVSCGTFISEVTDVIVPSERKTALEEVVT